MRRPGELTITETANLLEVHPGTVRRWAQTTVSGGPSRLASVRVDLVGRYWIHRRDVERLRLEERALNYEEDPELDTAASWGTT